MLRKLKAVVVAAAVSGLIALGGASSAQAFNVGTHATPVGAGSTAATANAGASRYVINGSLPTNCTATSANATIDTGHSRASVPRR